MQCHDHMMLLCIKKNIKLKKALKKKKKSVCLHGENMQNFRCMLRMWIICNKNGAFTFYLYLSSYTNVFFWWVGCWNLPLHGRGRGSAHIWIIECASARSQNKGTFIPTAVDFLSLQCALSRSISQDRQPIKSRIFLISYRALWPPNALSLSL